jgi:hypothetical protein
MKNLNKITALITLVLTAMFSQFVYAKGPVPKEIKQVVISKYPTAEKINWKEYSDAGYLACFVVGEEEVDVFVNKRGEIFESITQLTEANIPQEIKNFIAGMHDANLYYVLETNFSTGERVYIAKVKLSGELYELSFDSNFKLISTK